MASNIPDDEITCPVCFDTYSRPKVLRCGHTFCEICIHEYVMKNKERGTLKNGIECPICRTVTVVQSDPCRPDIWAKSLGSNFALETILATSVKSKTRKEEKDKSNDLNFPFVCQPCIEQGKYLAASVFCTDCSQYQCAECAKMHAKFEVTKGHDITIIDGKEEKLKFLSSIKHMQLCNKHHIKNLYLCTSDNQLCCSTCVIENHKRCKILKIEDVAKSNRLVKTQKSVKDLTVKVKSAAKFWSTRNDDIESQAETLQKEIQARRERVMKMFDSLEKRALSFLKMANKERNQEYTRNRKSCETLAADIDKTLDICDSAIKHGTSLQRYIVALDIEDRLARYYKTSAKEFSKLKSTKVMVNYLHIADETQNAGEELGRPFLYSAKIHVDDIQDYVLDSPLKLKFRAKQKSGSWYRSIDFLTDGRLVAIDHFKRKLLLFDKQLMCISEQDLAVRPFSVKALDSDDVVLVTSGKAGLLFYFQVKADDTLYLARSMEVKACCDTIEAIDKKSVFVGLFGGRQPLGVVLNNGEEKNVSIDLPEKQYTAENSKFVFNSSTGKLAINDKSMDTVYIIDSKYNKKISIRSESIMQPRGMAFGPNGTLFICSGGTDSIVQMTADGRVLASRKLNVSHPYAICISRDNSQLAMANMEINDKQLQVFDIVSAKC